MASHLGEFFRSRRIEQGLTIGQVARLAGYCNVNKGIRRILQFEREGTIRKDLLFRLTEALKITDWDLYKALVEHFRQQRLQEASEQFRPYLVVRYMACVYARHSLPDGIETAADAEEYACDYARQHRWRVCLVLSRRRCVWIGAGGQVERREETLLGQIGLPISHVRDDRRPLWFDPPG